MKQPNLNKLILDKKGTQKIRANARSSKKIKITINIEEESLELLKAEASKSGASYQKLLNSILKEGLNKKLSTESRLEKLEKEIEKIRKKLAA